MSRAFNIIPGGDLLSHTDAHVMPLALGGLTGLFGMGTGLGVFLIGAEEGKMY